MEESIRKYRDRLRIIILLYTFCERLQIDTEDYYGIFRSEIKIQALDFLLRYPDFLAMELMDLMDFDESIDKSDIKNIITSIYIDKEPEIRVEEMKKFFHGAYESLDDVIAFHVSVGFLKHESKKRIDGKNYENNYYVTNLCSTKIEKHLKVIPSVQWYFERNELIKKYFDKFSGSELKERQYKYSEYREISYKSYIKSINEKVKIAFNERFNENLS